MTDGKEQQKTPQEDRPNEQQERQQPEPPQKQPAEAPGHPLPRNLQRMRDSLDRPARENLLTLLPKRTIAKVVFLLILLGGVIYLKTRTDLLLGVIAPETQTGAPVPRLPHTNTNPVPSSPR